MEKFKLFCLPHAGGSAIAYKQWKKYLDKDIKLIPIELAGRGKRSKELFYKDIDEAIDDIYSIILESQKEKSLPYGIFGHSMGALLTYEITLKIQQNQDVAKPNIIFFSGRDSPNIFSDEKEFLSLSEEHQRKKIISYGGIPQEIINNKKWYDLFIKIIKADYEISGNYVYKESDKIKSLAYVLTGIFDEHIKANLEEWNTVTLEKCIIKQFNGGHFFTNDYVDKVVKYINDAIIQNQ